MGIEKIGIRWGRGQKRKSAKPTAELQREVATNSADLDSLSAQVARLEEQLEFICTELDVQLPHYVEGRRVR